MGGGGSSFRAKHVAAAHLYFARVPNSNRRERENGETTRDLGFLFRKKQRIPNSNRREEDKRTLFLRCNAVDLADDRVILRLYDWR